MASSDSGMSEYNNALLKKFQGNGWRLTYSADSQKEIAAILGDIVSAEKQAERICASGLLPTIRYESDWADTVLERMIAWSPEETNAPLWLEKATAASDFAFFQLPAPDRRWVLKFDGRILGLLTIAWVGGQTYTS
jgi:hypothetical protein